MKSMAKLSVLVIFKVSCQNKKIDNLSQMHRIIILNLLILSIFYSKLLLLQNKILRSIVKIHNVYY